jgi:hypothetical protein
MPDDAPAPPTTARTPLVPDPSPADQSEPPQNYWDYCPNCSTRLHNMGCKYRCPQCHYFMSCSDFD